MVLSFHMTNVSTKNVKIYHSHLEISYAKPHKHTYTLKRRRDCSWQQPSCVKKNPSQEGHTLEPSTVVMGIHPESVSNLYLRVNVGSAQRRHAQYYDWHPAAEIREYNQRHFTRHCVTSFVAPQTSLGSLLCPSCHIKHDKVCTGNKHEREKV